jgi:Phage major capsid protein E
MPQPSSYDVHVDVPLSNIATAYIQDQDAFIASKVFPIVPVDKQSNKYYTFPKAQWFSDDVQLRGDGAESAGSGYSVSTDNYFASVYALHKDIGHLTLANFDNPLDPMSSATEFITQQMLQRMERQWVTDYFSTGIWGTDTTLSGSSQWSDETGSNPIDDIELGKETLLSNTGFAANTLVLGYQVFRKLKNHPDIVDRMKYTSNAVITEDILARLFGVDRILVARAVKNTANEGATASMSFIVGKSALLMYVNPSPGILKPSAGYTFSWTKPDAGYASPVTIMRWYNEDRKAWRVEGESAWANKVVGSDLGYFLATAVA